MLFMLFMLLTGCTMFVKAPVVTVQDLNVVSLDGGSVGMELYLKVKNTNPYDLELLGYSYDLQVTALPLAKGGARDQVKFPSGVETDLRIPLRVAYGDLLEVLKRNPDPENIPYQLSAALDLDTPLGGLSVPVHRSGTYAVPKQYRPSTLLKKLGDFFKMKR